MRVMVLNPPSVYSKNVVRDLVYGCWCKGKRIASAQFPPLSLLYIASMLEKEGHDIIFLDAQTEGKSLAQVEEIASERRPEIIIMPTSTMSFREDAKTLELLKKASGAVSLVYGSHVTFLPKVSLGQKGIDYIAMREPEFIIRDFVNAMGKGTGHEKVNGIGYRKGGKAVINPPYPFIQNLDDLPFPDRRHISKFTYFNPLVKRIHWTAAMTSRGCPGRCLFCSSPNFYGNTLRMRSAKNVVDELEDIRGLGYEEVFFRDETFTAHRKRVEEICNLMIERGLNLTWICNARVDTVDKELLTLMKKAGCHLIKFGVESGVQQILDNINKMIRVEMTRKTFRWAHEVGMETHAHMMLGCIGETKETIKKTMKFIKQLDPTTVTFGAFTPYPGTKIFDIVTKEKPEIGDGSSCDLSKLHTSGFYNYVFCDLTENEIGEAVFNAYRQFYLRPSYIIKRLMSVRSPTQMRRLIFAGLEVLSFTMNRGGGDVE
jgi:radical SAM superfamily enzyme YgiQ (UPF0313 family)